MAPSVHVVPSRIRPQPPLSRLGPTPPTARRSVGEAYIPRDCRLATRPRRGLLRDDMDCAESWAERAGRHTWPGRDDTKTTCTRSAPMRLKASLYLTVAAIGIASLVAAAPAQLRAQTAIAIDNDDIGGVVTGANGPEAGVWVIAETTDLPTRYAKIVVTNDQGRYVLPD